MEWIVVELLPCPRCDDQALVEAHRGPDVFVACAACEYAATTDVLAARDLTADLI